MPSVQEKHLPVGMESGEEITESYYEVVTPKYPPITTELADSKKTNIQDSPSKDGTSPSSDPKRVGFLELFRFATRYDYWLIAGGTLASMLGGAAFPVMALLFGNALNSFAPVDLGQIRTVALEFIGLAIFIFFADFLGYSCMQCSSERQVHALRVACVKATLRQDISWYDVQPTGGISTRIAGDTQKLQEGIGSKLSEAIKYTSQFISGVVIGLYRGWNLALVMATVMPVMTLSLGLLIMTFIKSTVNQQKAFSSAGAVADESFSSIRTVVSLNAQKRAASQFYKNLLYAEEVHTKYSKSIGLAMGATMMVIWFMYALGLWYGGKLVSDENSYVTTPGDALAVFFSILIGSIALGQIGPCAGSVASAMGAAPNLYEILARRPVIDSYDESGIVPTTCEGHIEIKDVHFSYPSRMDIPILNGYNLVIESGQKVALVGSSGGGKSTVVSLLERFYNPLKGQVVLDGNDIQTLNISWLRSKIGLVGQEPALFATTISENIRYGKLDATQEEIIQAAKMSNAHDFIMSFSNGYDTLVGEQGVQLSGGQKQRIAIARAIIKDPTILLLDEATSALDNESERVVQAALDHLLKLKKRTTIIIAHRLSTIRDADKIAVIQGGQIVEIGQHRQLMDIENGIYHELVRLQERHVEESKIEPNKTKNEVVDQHIHTVQVDNSNTPVSQVEKEKVVTSKFSLVRLWRLNKPEYLILFFGMVASGLNGFVYPGSALLISSIIATMQNKYNDYLNNPDDKSPLNSLYDDVCVYAAIYTGGAVAVCIINFLQSYCFRFAEGKLVTRIRDIYFRAILRQDISYFDDQINSTGALTTRITVNPTTIAKIAGENQGLLFRNFATIASAFLISFIIGSWILTLVVSALFPLIVFGHVSRHKASHRVQKSNNEALAEAGATSSEAINNIRTVASFSLQKIITGRYDGLLDVARKKAEKEAWNAGANLALGTASMFFMYALVFWYGGYLVKEDTINFTQLIRSLMVLMMAAQSAGFSLSALGDSQSAKTAAQEIFELEDVIPKIESSIDNELRLPELNGKIEVSHVYFHYPSRPDIPIMKDYNLVIEAGQTVAFCGPSGGGKSTLISLLERFYDPISGTIFLDGHDLRKFNITWLRDQIGLVGQEPVLFSATIAENISYGYPDATREQIESAAKLANASNFITNFPDGYETQVGLKGTQLSGGQKQRIAIARAILKNPNILLLDEATSALDSESERVVQNALDDLLKVRRRTTLIIAHRLSTIRNADQICVVSKGCVAEKGTHQELLELRGIYANLAGQQEGH